MKITTKTMMENTSFYKVPLKVFNKLQKAETKEEKYKVEWYRLIKEWSRMYA